MIVCQCSLAGTAFCAVCPNKPNIKSYLPPDHPSWVYKEAEEN